MIREKLMSSDRNYVFVAMHRGDWRNYPENSRDAILSCIALGADIVELDVQMTKDGRFVLLHDNSLDRTTTGQGKASEHTLAEIKKLRLKSNQGGKDAKATDYDILTLEEALALAKGKILINIDKFTLHPYEILQAVEKAGALKDVLVKSTHGPANAKRLFKEYWKYVESGELLYRTALHAGCPVLLEESRTRREDTPAVDRGGAAQGVDVRDVHGFRRGRGADREGPHGARRAPHLDQHDVGLPQLRPRRGARLHQSG